jgi:hypothetical protein
VAARHGKEPAKKQRKPMEHRRMPFAVFVRPQRSRGSVESVQTSTKQRCTFAK